jgi:AraC family ethanolamine operon transcriptional activator
MTDIASPIVRRIGFQTFDPEAMRETLQGSLLEHTPLEAGGFAGQLLQATAGDLRLDFGQYELPVLARGPLSTDRLTIGLVLQSEGPCVFNAQPVSPGDLVLYGENEELHTRLAGGVRWVAIQVDRLCCAEVGLDLPERLSTVLAADDSAVSGLTAQLGLALDHLRADGKSTDAAPAVSREVVVSARDALVAAVAAGFGERRATRISKGSDQAWSRMRLLRRAEGYLEAHLAEPIAIVDLCRALDCPIHVLERAFSKVHGISPKRFLTHRRLTRLRQLLLTADAAETSITEALLDCGLHHAGRAAAAYRHLFGELPGETLRQPPTPAVAARSGVR